MTDQQITEIYERGKGKSHMSGLRAVYEAGRAFKPAPARPAPVVPAPAPAPVMKAKPRGKRKRGG